MYLEREIGSQTTWVALLFLDQISTHTAPHDSTASCTCTAGQLKRQKIEHPIDLCE